MLNRLKENFTKARILSITTLFSYVTGLLRDRIFAQTFGAGRELDIYNTSFIIPDILFYILIAGAFSAAFIPVFTGLLAENKREEANELANTTLNSAVVAILVFGAVAALFMPALARFVAPGFSDSERETLITLSRFMMISPIIMTVSSAFGAMLIGRKTF